MWELKLRSHITVRRVERNTVKTTFQFNSSVCDSVVFSSRIGPFQSDFQQVIVLSAENSDFFFYPEQVFATHGFSLSRNVMFRAPKELGIPVVLTPICLIN